MILDPASLYALPRNLVLAASAGTGKTHALVGVVIHLLVTDRPAGGHRAAQPLDPSRVVATTFSRKAAAEIRSRVTQELERLATAPGTSAYVASLRAGGVKAGAGGLGDAGSVAGPLSDVDIRIRARRALARLPAARFGTLHSFATGIVRAHAVELGLGPGFELASEADARGRAEDAIARALESRLAASGEGVRALAEAAGGVDRLVSQLRRILVQLEEDGRAARDLAVADGDAEAIQRGVVELVDHARSLQAAPKFDGAARDLVSAWQRRDEPAVEAAAAALCAIPALGKKTPELDAFAVFRRTLAGTTNEEKGRRLARAFRMRHRFVAYARLVRDVLGTAEVQIEREGRARAALGFGEVLRAARELLRDRPDVAEEVAGAIDALLVDEFQDTSRVQRDLLQLLWARGETREAGRVPPLAAVRSEGLLVVGDRKQSIYGFRGADVGVFAELAVGLAGAPAREALGIPAGVTWEPREPLADFCSLRYNRRSAPELLAFANAFSPRRFCAGDPPPQLFEIVYVAGTEDLLVPPERAPADGGTPLAPRTTWLRIHPQGPNSTRLDEALVIAQRIGRIVKDGTVRIGADARRVAFRDLAVLATTNGMLDATAFALAQADIPYVVAGKSFFRTREVRDLAAMLALVLDPSDRLATLEVLRGPWVGAHDETLLGLTRSGDGLVAPYAWAAPPVPSLIHGEDRAELADTAALVGELARCAGRLGPGSILREAVRARGLEEVLAGLPRGDQRVANVRKLLTIADRYTDARAFLTLLHDASEQENAESEAATFADGDDAVRLLTVHASKGLDFPVVFVPEIGAGLPRSDKGAARVSLGAGDEPNVLAVRAADDRGMLLEPPSFARAQATKQRRERAERQRLAYVAITRAADVMFLVGGRTKEATGDLGASTLSALEQIAGDEAACRLAALVVEDVEVPPPTVGRHDDGESGLATSSPLRRPDAAPAWRSLPIAPTALADFDHCARRFELIHLLGMPEHLRGGRAPASLPAAHGRASVGAALDARAQGTLAHAVLERVPATAFAGEDAEACASRALAAEGIAPDHAQHAAIVARVARFLHGSYAQSLAAAGAELRREVAFVLVVDDREGRSIVLRGSIDLLVVWPDGAVDVVDYKSARGGGGPEGSLGEASPREGTREGTVGGGTVQQGTGEGRTGKGAYAFQLDVYALAARASFPSAPRFRAGLVYLGGALAAGEPAWRALPDEQVVRERLAELGDTLVRARWSGAFPRVSLERCEAIHCGFIGRCHASGPGEASGRASVELAGKDTDSSPPRATTT